MEHLRALPSGPGPAAAGLSGVPAPVSTPFAAELFEEGARAGAPRNSLARQVATLDSQTRRGMGDELALDLDRREFALADSGPDSELSFGDLLDVINPLQHIPIVGNIYRELTGDTISGPARVAGAALYGGPVGMLAGIVNAITAEISGDDLGGSLIAAFKDETPPEDTLLAEAPEAVDLEPAAKDTTPAYFAPQAEAGVLTGDAALGALLGDLRAAPAVPMELPDLSPAFGARGFSEQMMLGMDKYRALAIERGGAGRPALDRVDRQF